MSADSTTDTEAQEYRAKLRMQYLRGVSSLFGKKATFRMHNAVKVTCVMAGADPEGQYFCVKQLKTPVEDINDAFLRTSDIVSVVVKINSETS